MAEEEGRRGESETGWGNVDGGCIDPVAGPSSATISERVKLPTFGTGVGKYIRPDVVRAQKREAEQSTMAIGKKKQLKSTLNDFSAW
jgi:hypothetical protein